MFLNRRAACSRCYHVVVLQWGAARGRHLSTDRQSSRRMDGLTEGLMERGGQWTVEPTRPALQVHRCMLVLIWTPASFVWMCVHADCAHSTPLGSVCENVSAWLWGRAFDYERPHAGVSVCASVCACLRCVRVPVYYLIKASVKPGGTQHPHSALELERRSLQNRCKQLRASSVSIKQTDSSCEQGWWLTASHQIKRTWSARREANAMWSPYYAPSPWSIHTEIRLVSVNTIWE